MPFAKETAYTALCAFDGAFDPPPPVEPEPVVTPMVTSVPQRHDDIVIGSAVLAAETLDEPWYRAIVIGTRGEGLFVLAWQDWPDEPTFVRQGDSLALWPPALASDHVPLSQAAREVPPAESS